jgi:hypothetical protein
MAQEFVTVYGKAVIERNVLFIRSFDVPITRTAVAMLFLEICYILVFIVHLFGNEGPFYYVGIVVWGSLLAFRTPEIYDALIKRSYSSRIPLNRIQSATLSDDNFGLQTYVTLHLKNGRYRKIIFRKLENQYNAFIEAISTHTTESQLA